VSERIQAPRGTYDVLPEEAARRAEVEKIAGRILGGAGYGRIETPIFEATELFARGVGEATDIVRKEMYTFDDGGGRLISLRPEATASISRAYIEHGMHKLPQPVRLWCLGPFFRRERAQAGRYRQFWQVDAEVFGSDAPAVDAETIVLLAELLEALGVKGTRLRLGSLGMPETRAAYREQLRDYLRAHESELSADVRERIDLNPMRAFDADDPGTKRVMESAPRLMDELAPEDAAHFAEVRGLLDDAGLAYEIDPTLVRGLDYYTRTVFEFTSDALGAQSGVAGGGRYDKLVEQIGGTPTPAVGWAAGIERVLMAGEGVASPASPVDLYVALATDDPAQSRAGFRLANEARRAGLAAQVEVAGRSLKGQLKHANRLGARHVAVLGADGASVKDMESGEERTMPLDEVIASVRR
jgi:histidyl-tRNA synthetase